MNNLYLGLKFALSYFTILPIKFDENVDLSKKEILGSMLMFLPLVGFLLGCITLIVYSFLDSIPWLGAIISACLYMIFYGFIHTEAILDVVDAVYAKHGGKDPYTVIKEPTVGAMGVLYSLVFVIIKVASLSFLLINNFFLEFLSILIISGLSVQFLILNFDFKSSFVTRLKKSFGQKKFFFSLFSNVLVVFLLINLYFLSVIAFAFLFSFFIAKFFKKNIGFLNGDTLGVSLELVEIILFIGVVFLL